ncbi:MAG: 4'-phosphopantetheinyl transferase superfamily protein, partial [Clostridium sp.]
KLKISSFKLLEDKVRSLGCEILLHRALSLHNIDLSKCNIMTKEHGKPYIQGKNIHYNLSHSGEYVVCAISSNPVGIDIEKLRSININIVNRFYSEDEKTYIESLDKDKVLDGFFRIWSCKESYIKYNGLGLSIPLNSFTVNLDKKTIISQDPKEKCKLYEFSVGEYKIAVCTKSDKCGDLTNIEIV